MGAADLVLEGGGVKGAGLAGAVTALNGTFDFHRVAGTSAGAIVASFIAAGLAGDLESIMVNTDFAQFEDEGGGLLRYLGPRRPGRADPVPRRHLQGRGPARVDRLDAGQGRRPHVG